jgi:alpha-glucoside transport system substrate-binding protein
VRRAALIAAVLALGAFAGCGGGDRAAAPADAIEIFGPYRGAEADRLVEILQPWSERTGKAVRYIGSLDFVSDLRRRVEESGDPPDIAIIPQPGLIRGFAQEGQLVPVPDRTLAAVRENYSAEAARLGQLEGEQYAVPFRLTVKSLVWYRPALFRQRGWTVPRTSAELGRLVRAAAGAGLAPWCFSMASGSATGWPATDWVEDLVLRSEGPDRYRRWATGAIPFSDPAIARAFDRFRTLVLDPGQVAGGIEAVAQTLVAEAWEPLLADPPGCALYKQADFAADWMPADTTFGPRGDVDWFVLPGDDAGLPPVLVGGDQLVQFDRDPDVDDLMTYLAGPTAGASWVARGGFVSPKRTIGLDVYPPGNPRNVAELIAQRPQLAFDASDQMPPDVGSGLLWSGIADWVAGAVTYEELARSVDRALRRAGE